MSKNKSVENIELNEVLKETMNEILESDLEDVKLGKDTKRKVTSDIRSGEGSDWADNETNFLLKRKFDQRNILDKILFIPKEEVFSFPKTLFFF